MTNQDLERRLAKAILHTAPDNVKGVLSRCETPKGNVVHMTKSRKKSVVRNLVAACLTLVLLGGGGMAYHQAFAVTSVVSLDVNPGIELEVNRQGRVLSCAALNEEAKTVLSDMQGGDDLKNTKLDVAVNAIVGALVRNGYLDRISSAILISVEDKDQTRAVRLQRELTSAVDSVLQEQAAGAAVLSQTVQKNTNLEKQARENSISTGKASLVNRVLALNSALRFDALAALSVEELKDMAESGAAAMPIGRKEALRGALSHAGWKDTDIWRSEVDAELDDVVPHYDVELKTASGEYKMMVDAYTGKVLRSEIEPPERKEKTPDLVVDKPDNQSQQPTISGHERAKEIALVHAGLQAAQVTALRVEEDRDDGRLEYEVEFKCGGMEYDYTIDAATFTILEHEKERND